MFKYLLGSAALATLLVGFAGPAGANPLPPGGSTGVPTGIPEGTIVASQTSAFDFTSTGGQTHVGTVQQEVVRTASGNLDFLYQVSFNSGSGTIGSFGVHNYAGFATDVIQNTDGTVFQPGTTTRAPGNIFTTGTKTAIMAERGLSGATILYTLESALRAGQSSFVQIIQTDATLFDNKGVVDVNGGPQEGSFGINGTLEPLASGGPQIVPEPSTMAMWGGVALGLVGYMAVRRRKLASAAPQVA
ncbi:MAG: PEP-CTERM sorting domain-containing protein [Gemmataceae bacterium]